MENVDFLYFQCRDQHFSNRLDILVTIFFASFKFALTFPLAILEFGFSFFETLLWMNIGGLLGIYFFALLSEGLNQLLNRILLKLRNSGKKSNPLKRRKKVFTKRNRRIIRIKQKYGFAGIVITTPLLLSIPVGAFLVVRYYPRKRGKFMALVLSNVLWSLVYIPFYMFWKEAIFGG